MELVFQAGGFEWDEFNAGKIWQKHRIKFSECEEVFFDPTLKTFPDEAHSLHEKRYFLLGRTKTGRYVFAAFTQRKGNIRVISARSMSRKERKVYHEKT